MHFYIAVLGVLLVAIIGIWVWSHKSTDPRHLLISTLERNGFSGVLIRHQDFGHWQSAFGEVTTKKGRRVRFSASPSEDGMHLVISDSVTGRSLETLTIAT